MSRDASRKWILAVALALACPVFAQDNTALINQRLDLPVKVQFDTVLPEAMNVIGRSTGVRVQAQELVWDLLPWGRQTNISAKIENQTLRQALDAITRKLGLVYTMKDDVVELQPMPALRRIGRRATVQELQALDFLTSHTIDLKAERPTIKELIDAVDGKLNAAKTPFAVEYRPGDVGRPDKTVFISRNATLAEALDAISKETGLTWYPWGKSIQVVPKEEQIRIQLNKPLSQKFPGVDVAQVLNELSQRSGVRFEIEPGALQRIPADVRSIHLMLDNSTVTQALETIAGFTGLGYVITPRGVYFWNQSYQTPGTRDKIVGSITLPDSGVQLFLFESQVPPDMKDYFKFQREKHLEKIRQQMTEQGFRPTTTTQPAAESQDHDL